MLKTSKKVIKKHRPALLIMLVGSIAVASTIVALSIKRDEEPRTPASVKNGKLSTLLNGSGYSTTRDHDKGGGYLDVEVQSKTQGALTAGETATLEASVVAHASVDELEYSWLLPEGISLQDGAREGSLGRLLPGEKRKLSVSVVSSTNSNRQIHLHVYRMVNGEANGQIAQFNTVDQPKFERAVREKLETIKGGARTASALRIQQ